MSRYARFAPPWMPARSVVSDADTEVGRHGFASEDATGAVAVDPPAPGGTLVGHRRATRRAARRSQRFGSIGQGRLRFLPPVPGRVATVEGRSRA